MERVSKRTIRLQAKAWMVMEQMRIVDIQRALGHKQHVQAVETLTGVRDHRQVLRYLLEKGCPAKYLALPNDMKEAT